MADAAAHFNATFLAVNSQKIDKFGTAIYATWLASPSADTGISGLKAFVMCIGATPSG